ncbi:transcriptional regulator GcvA [Bradyrhizobium jicamae]|uniref:Transcriptional regulator GcvA n=1 Tax=Bradyrhizobium jicamae TaxID=280332 RepID=A0ABS5FHG2_9BRAD|nr:transcriptional regulator GcvA [Bradyrhizobium jicamae]MBR0796182.1 transcriptional regulator GcvA [Bradyrhizobium jicamae]MBR0937732.1 transcriptional regulator GcvA [Bradyrhizobium jicamae]
MNDRLPPLNALKAFESAARHLSVKLAAEELCVTPGAVSQMLKTLESHLGIKLFERVPRGIYLTDAGRDYLPSIRNAFRQIAEASRRVAASTDVGTLTVSVTPFFASAWLVPRLASFQDAHPEIDLQIVTSSALVDFSRSGIDVAVRHGLGRYPGLRSDRVVTVEMVAVAAPSLVARLGRPTSPSDLARWPQVHDADRKGWSLWFQSNGVDEVRAPRGPSFDDTGLLLTAVLSGQGTGLLPAAMVANEIAGGQLVQLLETAQMEEFAYYLVCPDNRQGLPKIVAFREWILGPIAQSAHADR